MSKVKRKKTGVIKTVAAASKPVAASSISLSDYGLTSIAELSAQLGVSRQRVHQLIAKRKVDIVPIKGSMFVVPLTEVPKLTAVHVDELPPKGLLNMEQAAEFLQRSVPCLVVYLRQKRIAPAVRHCRRLYFRPEDLIALRDSLRPPGRPRKVAEVS